MNLEEREINLLGKCCVRNGTWVFKNRSGLPPGYLPKTPKFMSHRATCTSRLVAMFFTVAQLWHQPSVQQQRTGKDVWCVYTVGFLPVRKEPSYGVCRKIVQLGIIISSASEGQLSIICLWFLNLCTKSYRQH